MNVNSSTLNGADVTSIRLVCRTDKISKYFYLASLSENEKKTFSELRHPCPLCSKPMDVSITQLDGIFQFDHGTLRLSDHNFLELELNGLTLNVKTLFDLGYSGQIKIILPDGELSIYPDFFDYSVVFPNILKRKNKNGR